MFLAVNTTAQLLHLRLLMVNLTLTGTDVGLSAYIVPLSDAHAGERIASCDQRLHYISGFSGSAGNAIITLNNASLWTDGRYFTQAVEELDGNWELMKMDTDGFPTEGEYINKNLAHGSLIGVDPSLYSKTRWDELQTTLKIGGHILTPVERNLVDLTWGQRPPCPAEQVYTLEEIYTGRNTSSKLGEIREEMRGQGVDAIVLSQLDEIAWLLNLRGSDLSSSSVFISYLIILEGRFLLFINPNKIKDLSIISKIQSDGGEIHAYQNIGTELSALAGTLTGKIWLSTTCNYALVRRVPESKQFVKLTPISLMKAVKNSVEVQGMKTAHIKDAVAITRFFTWLEGALLRGEVLSELSCVDRLLEFRKQDVNFLTTSFSTIAGSGSNGAIIHYRPTPETNKNVTTNDMFLLDSGRIYREGTTDITRTIHFGNPTDFQREAYTRVLKGQIAIVTSTFPSKIAATRLDSFARRALWSVGLDYNHGTGHGIGHALNVHEGTSRIHMNHNPEDPGLRENMFSSNEPGYYHVENANSTEPGFGIRLENIIRVVNVTLKNNFQSIGFLGFEDITFVPYRHSLIKTELLTASELKYFNEYQQKTRDIVGQYIKNMNPTDPAYDWLIKETMPIPG